MADYWVTFRIEDDQNYLQRYAEFMEALRDAASKWWTEPTSFIAFTAEKDIDAVANSLKSAIDTSKDLFLIHQIGFKNARICGNNGDPDIHKMMPYLKKC